MKWVYDTGGREKYYKALNVGDCVVRAIAIANQMDYKETYNLVKKYNGGETPRNGVYKIVYGRLLRDLGWKYISCCEDGHDEVFLRTGQLPEQGVIICRLARHAVTIIDGVIHDTYNSYGDGNRRVYGYWEKTNADNDQYDRISVETKICDMKSAKR